MIFQIQFLKISTAGCQSYPAACLNCFNSDNNAKKNIDKTILYCHKSSQSNSAKLYRKRSTIPSWA